MYNPDRELVQIVDRNNVETTTVTRKEMRQRGLIHRATYILVFNSRGELFVQKRTMTKDVYPGYYDIAAGGVVLAGDTYEESARRELEEELGIRDVPLRHHFEFFYQDGETNRVWGSVWSCTYDGVLTLQEEEVESGRWMAPEKVLASARQEKFTPDGIFVLERFIRQGL